MISYDEQDAISEISNIFAGTAACILSDRLDTDVNISVPNVTEKKPNEALYDVDKHYMVYKLSFVAFTVGYCTFNIEESIDELLIFLEKASININAIADIISETIVAAVKPLELLMGQAINLEKIEEGLPFWERESDTYISVKIKFILDKSVFANVILNFSEQVAKSIASKFLIQGVAVNTI